MLPKIKPLSLFIGFYLLYSSCYGQQKFEALVLDEHYRPVPGASIVIKGTRGGAATDSEGKISLRIPLHRGPITLVISSEGTASEEKQVDNFDSLYTIRLLSPPPDPLADPAGVVDFPWPPSQYSAEAVLDSNLFKSARYLSDVDRQLSGALDSLRYEKRYYEITDGFALVTHIEQIDKYGVAMPPPDRWCVETAPMRQLSWHEYLRRLFFPTPGYFRIFVFVITDQPFTAFNQTISRDDAIHWLQYGMNILPPERGQLPFSRRKYKPTVLIYEYKKPETGEPILDQSGLLTGYEHLKQSKLLDLLQQK